MEQSFIAYIENSIKNNWDLDALTDYKGATLQYKDVARKIEKLHIIFEESGIRKGDKIAVCGRNSSHWGVTFLATLTYGAVVVPILHEFKADNIHNIVNHSESRLLFVGDVVSPTIDAGEMPALEGIIYIPDFSLTMSRSETLTFAREHLNKLFGEEYPKAFQRSHVSYHQDSPEELADVDRGLTITGQTKSGRRGAHGGSRPPVIGVSNAERRAQLEQQLLDIHQMQLELDTAQERCEQALAATLNNKDNR